MAPLVSYLAEHRCRSQYLFHVMQLGKATKDKHSRKKHLWGTRAAHVHNHEQNQIRKVTEKVTNYTISGLLYQCKVAGRCLYTVNVVYVSDLTVMLFPVWSQGASGKKGWEKFKNILASILLTLYCNVTLLTWVTFTAIFLLMLKLYLMSKVLQVFWGKNSVV